MPEASTQPPRPEETSAIGGLRILLATLLLAATVSGLFLWGIHSFTRHADHQRKAALTEKVSMAQHALEPILAELRAGHLDRATALEAAKRTIRDLRYEDEFGPNYIFMNAMDSTVLVRPYRPQDEGTRNLDFQDSTGLHVFHVVIPRLRAHPDGVFQTYRFPNPKTGRDDEKLAFFRLVPELDIMLGTGAYMSESTAAQLALVHRGFALALAFGLLCALPLALALRSLRARNERLWLEIREREHAEAELLQERQALREAMENIRIILDSIGDGVIATDTKGRVVRMNPVAEHLTGVTQAEAMGADVQDILRLLDASTRALRENPVIRTLAEGRIVSLQEDTLLVSRQGQESQVADSSAPIRDAEGQVAGAVLVLRDITESSRNREEARQKDMIFRAIFEASPYSIVIQRVSDLTYLLVNPRFVQATGLPAEEILGKQPTQVDISLSLSTEALREKLLKTGSIQGEVFTSRNREGQVRHGLLASRLIEYQHEPCVLSVVIDITELRRLQEELSHAQRMDAIGQLAGGVAHDFNNMLGGILGMAELLRTHDRPDQRNRYLDLIVDTCKRAAELTAKLLAFARKGKIESTAVDVHDAITAAMELLRRTIDKGVAIEADLKALESAVVGDSTLLMNVFINLGINAAQAMPQGGSLRFATRNTTLDTARCQAASAFGITPGPYLEVEIADTGCGIPPEHLGRIFDPFFTTKEQGKGTGLGLAAVYGIVRQHHGAIEVESRVGEGTAFRLLLPVTDAPVPRPSIDTETVRGTGRILLVDDEEIIRTTAKSMLENLGYRVLLASDGAEGLDLFAREREHIDLVILDMIMPKMSGRDCFMALKAVDPAVRVLIASGFSREGDLQELRQQGIQGFLHKPFNTQALGQAVASALRAEPLEAS